MKHTIRRNASYAIIGRGWSLSLGLIATPYIISQVGVQAFGAWVLLEAIVAYFSLAEMGIGTSFNKHIAEYHIKEEYDQVSNVVSAGFFFYLALGTLLTLLALLFRERLLGCFDFASVSADEVAFVYFALIAVMCLRLMASPFKGVITGLLRYDIFNVLMSITQTISFCGVLLWLHFGFGLPGLAFNAFAYALLDLIVIVVIAFRLVPQLHLKADRNTSNMFQRLFKYGLSIQVVAIAEVINGEIDKVFLGIFRSTAMVGIYEVGAKIANTTNSLAAIVLPILTPTTSQLQAAGQDEEIKQLYLRGTKVIALLIVPVSCIVVLHSEQLILLWLGKEGFEAAAVAARFLVMGFALYLIMGVGRLMSRGIGIPHHEMRSGILISASNLLLSFFMVRQWGIPGAVIASFIALVIGSGYFMIKFNRQLQVANRQVLRLILLPVLLAATAGLPSLWLSSPADWELLRGSGIRLQAFVHLTTVTSITFVIYFFLIFFSGLTHEYDDLRAMLTQTLKKSMKKKRGNPECLRGGKSK